MQNISHGKYLEKVAMYKCLILLLTISSLTYGAAPEEGQEIHEENITINDVVYKLKNGSYDSSYYGSGTMSENLSYLIIGDNFQDLNIEFRGQWIF